MEAYTHGTVHLLLLLSDKTPLRRPSVLKWVPVVRSVPDDPSPLIVPPAKVVVSPVECVVDATVVPVAFIQPRPLLLSVF